MFTPGFDLWFISREGLQFCWSSHEGSLTTSDDIVVDPTGVNDSPKHLAWCLTFLREKGVLPQETKRLKRLRSQNEPLNLEQLEYEGACDGLMTVTAVLEDGTEVSATKEVAYY